MIIWRAALLMLFSAFCFGAMNALIRLVGAELHSFEMVFFRNGFALLWLVPWAMTHVGTLRAIQRFDVLLIRSLIGLVAMYLFFYALVVLPLADTVAITFSMPLFATAGAALFLGENVRMRRWMATLAGFLGVIIILNPGSGFNSLTFIPLAAALCMACTVLLVKWLTRTVDPIAMVFVMLCITTPISFFPALFVWEWPSAAAWVMLIFVGGLGVLGQWSFTVAYKLADASLILPFDYFRLPFTAFFGFMLFAEIPSVGLWIGAAIIVCATLYIARRESQLARLNESRATQDEGRA